jgi:hypothetical protein
MTLLIERLSNPLNASSSVPALHILCAITVGKSIVDDALSIHIHLFDHARFSRVLAK